MTTAKNLLVPWPSPLVCGRLLRRRNRFLLDVKLESGKQVTAYCANPGSMESLVIPEARVWLSSNLDRPGSLQWTWEMVETPLGLVATNSAIGNRIGKAVLNAKRLKGLKRFKKIKSEARINSRTRIDFELLSANGSHFVEVKGAHLVYPDGNAYFPDSLTKRSSRQITDLMSLSSRGKKATILIVVPCASAECVRPSDSHDPKFSTVLRKASKIGLRIRAILVEPTPAGMLFKKEIPVDLRKYSLNQVDEWRKLNKPRTGWVAANRGSL